MKPQPARPAELFYSYAHEDEKLREKLNNHLSLLKSQGLVTEWNDRDIKAGDDWETEIDEHLNSARLILLLVSADFMASRYCYSVEMERALERHESGEALVIPVILRPVDWESGPFGKLQALPKDGKPVVNWKNRDEAFKNIAQGIRKVIKEFKPKAPTRTLIPRAPKVGFVARRDKEGRDIVERLKESLGPDKGQLVTLSGPGGVGKTTLAAEAARALKEVFEGRIVWSGAAGRTSYALSTLLDDTATQLNRPDLRTLAPDLKKQHVQALVSDPPALVVLDNYETIAPEEQRNIEDWFTEAQFPALITSRQRVEPAFNIQVAAMSPEEAQEFLDRLIAQTQDPDIFSPAVRQRVYETAEANPFLMEWVVAQIDAAQEPTTVLEELSHGEGDAAQRVFDRSFNLPQVGEDGRAALLALALFSPSASREALAAVSGFGDDPKRLNEAVKQLRALWLVKGLDENSRFTTEGLTRTLAAAHLSKDIRADEFRRRFVTCFLAYAKEHSQPTPEDYDLLEAEKDNLLGAIDTAFAREDWESCARMAVQLTSSVSGVLRVRGYWDDALRVSELALKGVRLSHVDRWIGRLAHNVALSHHHRGAHEEARRLYDESLEIKGKLNDQRGIAATLHQLGRLAQDQGELTEARRLYGESFEIKKKLNDQRGIAITLHQLAKLAYEQGDLAEARRLSRESLEIKEKLSDQRSIAIAITALAALAHEQGDLVEARRLFNESLEVMEKLGDKETLGIIFNNLGSISESEGNKTEAMRLLRKALSIFEGLGSPYADIVRQNLETIVSESSY